MSSNINSMERIAALEEKTIELGRNNTEANRTIRIISNQVNSLCVSQAKINATLDSLSEKIDDIRKFNREIISKVEGNIEKNKETCNSRQQETVKTLSGIISKQKVIYTIASLIAAGVVSIIVKIIVA